VAARARAAFLKSDYATALADMTAALAELRASLPEGVEIVETYDRSSLIDRAVENLRGKLAEELLVVVLVCAAFLFHFRSSLIVVISLPVGILAAFVVTDVEFAQFPGGDEDGALADVGHSARSIGQA